MLDSIYAASTDSYTLLRFYGLVISGSGSYIFVKRRLQYGERANLLCVEGTSVLFKYSLIAHSTSCPTLFTLLTLS